MKTLMLMSAFVGSIFFLNGCVVTPVATVTAVPPAVYIDPYPFVYVHPYYHGYYGGWRR